MIKFLQKNFLFIGLLISMNAYAQPTVYYVGGAGDITGARNGVLYHLMTDGLTVFDFGFNEVIVPGLGYDVTYKLDTEDSRDEGAGFDLIIATEAVNSGDADRYGDLPVPYMVTENLLGPGREDKPGGIYFSNIPDTTFGAGATTFITILDNSHPITSIYDVNQEIEVTFNFDGAELAGFEPESVAPAVTSLAKVNAPDTGPIFLAIADEGAAGLIAASGTIPPGFDPTPARRAWIGFHQGTVNLNDNDVLDPNNVAISPEGAVLYQRLVQWMAGVAVTADGTEAGVVLEPGSGSSVYEWSIF